MPVHRGRGAGNVRAGALERGRPRLRGCLALERGGPHSRGGVEPSSEADLTRGSFYPSSEAVLTRGASTVPPWRAAGTTRGVVVSFMCFRCAS
jgi:hypothetical protein